MGIRKPLGATAFALFGVAAMAGSCATTKTKLASAPPPASVSAAPAQPAAEPKTPAPGTSARQKLAKTGGMHTNDAARAIVKESEGVHLSAYRSGSQWLIGYGHAKGVSAGMTITAAEAERYLTEDLAVCEASVREAVSAPITGNQFSAMVSLCYNIGTGNFAGSSLVKRLNAGDEQAAADAFLAWSKAGGKILPRLLARRQKERALFLDGIDAPRA